MDIQINLLPEEFRPRPPVETRTLLLVFLIVGLLAGGAFLYMSKATAVSERIEIEERTAAVNAEAQAFSSDKEAAALTKSINALKAVEQSYDSFVGSRIHWGNSLDRIDELVPQGIDVNDVTQAGNSAVVSGVASNYSAVASYGRALDIDTRFTLAGVPSLSGSTFSLTVRVATGGGS
jgi:Tfp pilus assembly protein PilN